MTVAGLPWAASDVAAAVGWAIFHSLWQAAIVWLALAAFRRRVASPQARARASDVAIVLLLLALAATLWLCLGRAVQLPLTLASAQPLEVGPRGLILRQTPPSIGWAGTAAAWIAPALPWLVALWAAWCVARLAIHARAARLADRTLALAPDLPPPVLGPCRTLAQRLGISTPVRFVAAAFGDGPGTIGWRRPCVFVPPGVLGSMPAPQVEAIVAHELAHVARRDYLSAAARLVVETLFAANPFVRRIVAAANDDAESCCDRLALRHLPDPAIYARALAQLAERRLADRVALRASGGALKLRVLAILDPSAPTRSRAIWGRAGLSAAVAGAALLLLAAAASDAASQAREFEWLEDRSLCAAVADVLGLPPPGADRPAVPPSEIVRRIHDATAALGHDSDAPRRLRDALALATADGGVRATVHVARSCIEPGVLDALSLTPAQRRRLVRAMTFDNERTNRLDDAFRALRAPSALDRPEEIDRFLDRLSPSPIAQFSVAVELRAFAPEDVRAAWLAGVDRVGPNRLRQFAESIRPNDRFGPPQTINADVVKIRRLPDPRRRPVP